MACLPRLRASPLSTQLLSWYDSGYNPSDPKSVASGSAVAMLFVTLGLIYFTVMMYGAFTVRVPPEGWRPEASTRPPSRPSRW